jgi:hypothetical protein
VRRKVSNRIKARTRRHRRENESFRAKAREARKAQQSGRDPYWRFLEAGEGEEAEDEGGNSGFPGA